jgi:NAD-dependent deacetylase
VRDVRPRIVFFNEPAPNYTTLWDSLDSLTDDDVLLVIGTSGTVLPISQIAEMYTGFKIINNLAPESAIDDTHFNTVFHMPATEAAKGIDLILEERLHS